MRDGLDTLDLLKLCDGFNTAFSILNALYCKKGGLVMAHHNDIRNGFVDLDEKSFTPTHVYDDSLIFACCATQRPNAQQANSKLSP